MERSCSPVVERGEGPPSILLNPTPLHNAGSTLEGRAQKANPRGEVLAAGLRSLRLGLGA